MMKTDGMKLDIKVKVTCYKSDWAG